MIGAKLAACGLVVAGCGAGYQRVRTLEELPSGTCPHLEAGESCEPGARDYSVGATLGHGTASEVAGTAWFRWPLFDVELDERTMRRDMRDYHSLAGGVGTHLRPMIAWPEVNRYVDVLVDLGLDLGALDVSSRITGRGDGYIAVALDLFAPDFGSMRYLETGVPGLRIGARYTGYVQGWDSEATVELGVIWRWGEPIDLYRHWTIQRTGD